MKQERKDDQDYFAIPVHLTDPKDVPNFASDSVETIEAWIKIHLPEDIQKKALAAVLEQREKNRKED